MSEPAAFVTARLDDYEATAYDFQPCPAWVQRDVAAKRAILALHGGSHECSVLDEHGDTDSCAWVDDGRACSTVKLLAAIDSDHPDYDARWAP